MKTSKNYVRSIIAYLAVLLMVTANSSLVQARIAPSGGPYTVYAQVIFYDVVPGKEKEFESLLLSQKEQARALSRSIINERVLRNIDGVTTQYASYTKFIDRNDAARFLKTRLDSVKSLCRRSPESHMVALDRSYFANGRNASPSGMEFGASKTGQIAHIGLFIPAPEYSQEYLDALYRVKEATVTRKPAGYLGDDLLLEDSIGNPLAQAPYTPRPNKPASMSVNYGEYETLENAEDSYIDRAEPGNPELVALERIFFSTLQVPTRFYIFQVIGNY